MEITYEAVVALPPDEAFRFVAEPANWPTFFANMRSAEAADDWGRPGGSASMTNRFLGRTVRSQLRLTAWNPPTEFRYVATAPGHPVLDNRRVLTPVPDGTRLTGTTVLVGAHPRRLGHRIRLIMLRRVYQKAMARLPEAAGRAADLDASAQ